MPKLIEWNQETEQFLLDGIIAGNSICKLLKTLDISEATFYRRRLNDTAFERTIARAQEMAQEANIDRTEELASTATVENWQLVQFQCRNAQWIAGKRKPKKYGDKITQELTGEVNVKRVVSDI